ncbi:hypothetical protein D5086_013572 [Populus alba]|uniref:Uncharacterized protein n=1 Tax=Populus alba TaxID=43335 RepID=A0ACC4C5D1_POPAL
MGFDSHLRIANALISVYCKCANLEDALYIFVNIGGKDIVSWNSMIAGYARHGLAVQGIGLFERMKNQGVKPDAIAFLGVPSSCWHAGFMGVFGLTYKLQRTGCCWNQGALCYPCAVGELEVSEAIHKNASPLVPSSSAG